MVSTGTVYIGNEICDVLEVACQVNLVTSNIYLYDVEEKNLFGDDVGAALPTLDEKAPFGQDSDKLAQYAEGVHCWWETESESRRDWFAELQVGRVTLVQTSVKNINVG